MFYMSLSAHSHLHSVKMKIIPMQLVCLSIAVTFFGEIVIGSEQGLSLIVLTGLTSFGNGLDLLGLVGLRETVNANDVHFLLYTKGKDNRDTPDELLVGDNQVLNQSHFLFARPTRILIHGFGGGTHGWMMTMLQEYMAYDPNQNFILVDWGKLAAAPNYPRAVSNAQIVSNKTASLIEFLVNQGVVKREDIHLIRFSLGAQVVGQVGSRVSEKLTRITALDPALPLFDHADNKDRIDPSDAYTVEVMHTCGGRVGFYEPAGTVDWYPNGGRDQPGCRLDLTGVCAHSRAPEFWKESILTTVGFRGVKCSSFEDLQWGKCRGNETAVMGHFMPLNTTGIFYLTTNAKAPYAQG